MITTVPFQHVPVLKNPVDREFDMFKTHSSNSISINCVFYVQTFNILGYALHNCLISTISWRSVQYTKSVTAIDMPLCVIFAEDLDIITNYTPLRFPNRNAHELYKLVFENYTPFWRTRRKCCQNASVSTSTILSSALTLMIVLNYRGIPYMYILAINIAICLPKNSNIYAALS